jgi:hypothetical protein
MNDKAELELKIRERLEEIKPVPVRDSNAAYRARMQFLAMAVSANEEGRHKEWSSIFRKERFAMNVMISILVIAGLLLGGGATVSAAQDDLPNEPLYSLKLWSEDLSLQFRNEPEQKVERLMELAQVRIQEMTRLVDGDQAVPDQTRLRLEQHIHEALQLCSNLDDPALDTTLLQIRNRLQEQDRDMERLQLHTPQDAQLAQTRTMLQQRLQLVEAGLLNHETFRNAARNGFRYGQEEITPPAQNDNDQQNGQPTSIPAGPNPDPVGPNTGAGGPNEDPGGPNANPGGPNMDPGGLNGSTTPSPTNGGGSSGGMGPGDGSGGKDAGGNDSGGGGGGGQGSGSGGSGGGGSQDSGGGGGSGINKP